MQPDSAQRSALVHTRHDAAAPDLRRWLVAAGVLVGASLYGVFLAGCGSASPEPGELDSVEKSQGANIAPTADAEGPYVINLGESVVLDGTSSFDPDGSIVSFEWDLDRDGVFDDATGIAPPLSFADVENLVCNGSCRLGRQYVISLRVTDDDGDSAQDDSTLVIDPVGVDPACRVDVRRQVCTLNVPAGADVIRVGATRAFTSIQTAVASLPAVLTAPTAIVIDGGYYPGRVQIAGIGTSAANPLIITGDCIAGNRSDVLVDASLDQTAGSLNGFAVLNVSDVTIEGIDIRGARNDGIYFVQSPRGSIIDTQTYESRNNGIHFERSPDAFLDNNVSYNNGNNGISIRSSDDATLVDQLVAGNGGSGINIEASRDARVQGSVTLDNGVAQGASNNQNHGLVAWDDSDGVIVTDSAFCDNGFFGIYVFNSDAPRIEGNRMVNNGINGLKTYQSNNGVVDCNEITGSGEFGMHIRASSNYIVRNNRVWDNQKGIVFNEGSDNGVIFNNLVVFNEQAGITIAYGSLNAVIRHNTTAYSPSGNGIELWWGSTGATIEDNISAFNGAAGLHIEPDSQPGATWDFNLVHGNSPNYRHIGPGPNDVNDDPEFEGSFFLIQDESPAVDAGSQNFADSGLEAGATTDPDGAEDSGVVDIGYHHIPRCGGGLLPPPPPPPGKTQCILNVRPDACPLDLPPGTTVIRVGPTRAAPNDRINTAVAALGALAGPTALIVDEGVYPEHVLIGAPTATSPTAPLFIAADCIAGSRVNAILDGTGLLSPANDGIRNVLDNVHISGLRIINNRGNGIHYISAAGGSLRHNLIIDNGQNAVLLENGSDNTTIEGGEYARSGVHGINVQSSDGVELIDVHARFNVGSGVFFENSSDGIMRASTPLAAGNVSSASNNNGINGFLAFNGSNDAFVENSVFCENREFGVYLWSVSGGTIRRNLSLDNTINAIKVFDDPDGALVECNQAEWSGSFGILVRESNQVIVRHNRVPMNDKGIVFNLGSSDGEIYNNLITDGRQGGITLAFDAEDNQVFNNTVDGNFGAGYDTFNSSTGNEVFDNIFSNNGSGVFTFADSIPAADFNLFFNNGVDHIGLAAGANDVFADPLIVGDFFLDQLTPSPAIDAGSRSSAAAGLDTTTTDTLGAFDTGQVDIGFHHHDCMLYIPQP